MAVLSAAAGVAACLAVRIDGFPCSNDQRCPSGFHCYDVAANDTIQFRCYRTPPADAGTGLDGRGDGASDADLPGGPLPGEEIDRAPIAVPLFDGSVQLIGTWRGRVATQRWADGALGALTVLSPPGCGQHQLGAANHDELTAVWSCPSNGMAVAVASARGRIGLEWTPSTPPPFDEGIGPAALSLGAVTDAGALLAQITSAGTFRTLRITRHNGNAWAALPLKRITFEGDEPLSVQVASAADGSALVAWREVSSAAGGPVRVLEVSAGGGAAGEPHPLDEVGTDPLSAPSLFRDSSGYGLTVWKRAAATAGRVEIWARRSSMTNTWNLPVKIADAEGDPLIAGVIDGQMRAHVVWAAETGPLLSASHELGTAATAWSEPAEVDGTAITSVSGLAVAPLPSGFAAIWKRGVPEMRVLSLRAMTGDAPPAAIALGAVSPDVADATLTVLTEGRSSGSAASAFVAWIDPSRQLHTSTFLAR